MPPTASDSPAAVRECLVELLRLRPALSAELLSGTLGLPVPAFGTAQVETGCATSGSGLDAARGDASGPDATSDPDAIVVLLAGGAPVLAVMVDVQLDRDAGKRWMWPAAVAAARARLRCPVVLLVICADAPVAAWCATPIDTGHPRFELRPVVLAPDAVPLVTDPDRAARAPEMAAFSALVHGRHPCRNQVLHALAEALSVLDETRAQRLADLVLAGLPADGRRYLDALLDSSRPAGRVSPGASCRSR